MLLLMRILITCPPMIKQIDRYKDYLQSVGVDFYCPNVVQTLSEQELVELLPNFDGWIIGDDPATRTVFTAGKKGLLKAAVKWGVGVDNVDFNACKDLGIPIINTPGMFGNEVADIAICYLIGLARDLFLIDHETKNGSWYKPTGISLQDKKIAVIGCGNIGQQLVKRLIAFDTFIEIYDPYCNHGQFSNFYKVRFNNDLNGCLTDADFVVVTCSLTKDSYHMLNRDNLSLTKHDLRLVNVSRGPIINEKDMIELQKEGHIYGVALDVFETEPLPANNELRNFKTNIFGSHNASNTIEAVDRTSYKAIDLLCNFLFESTNTSV